jgi:hypothetical protein
MPYKITKGESGYFVYNPKTHKHYSKKGLPKIIAEKQRTEIILSEHKGEKKLGKYYM